MATPVSREIAKFPPKAQPVVRQHRLRAQIRRPALYLSVAGVAAIVFLLVAIDWRARIEQLVGHVIAPMANQPTAPSPSPGPTAGEPVDPVPVYVDPQYAEEGLQSGVEGRPPETIGPAELAELLTRAHQQIEAFALITPPGDNALETLQRVLAAMPGQPDALQGIHDIASRYAVLATQAERRGEHALARRYVDKGLRIVPDHPDLLAIQRTLATQPQQPRANWPAQGPPQSPEQSGQGSQR